MNQLDVELKEINQKITEECIDYFVIATQDRVSREDVIRHIADIVESTGGSIDACSRCGAMPMTTNCNNAGCDK